MTNRWTPVEIDAATAGPDFWTRYHAYRRLRLAETRPDDPIRPDRVIEDGMKRNDPFEIHYRYEISDGAKMLSWFSAEATRPGAPGYDTSQHLLWVEGSVHRDHRRRGIGQSWIPLVLELMNRQAYTTVGIECDEESGRPLRGHLCNQRHVVRPLQPDHRASGLHGRAARRAWAGPWEVVEGRDGHPPARALSRRRVVRH